MDRTLPVAGVVLAVSLWFLLTNFTGGTIIRMMAPSRVAAALVELLTRPRFYTQHVATSLYRFGVAISLCVGLGLPIGLAIGALDPAERLTTIVFQFLRVTSPIAWFPIAIAFLGTGSPPAIFVITMAGVWPVVFNTAYGVETMNDDWLKVGRTLGGDRRALLTRVLLPAVIPDVLTGVRLALGIAWIILVPAEMIGVSAGLGYFLLDARDRFAYAQVVAAILIIGTIGYVLDFSLRRLRNRLSYHRTGG
ncbi:MAG: ABC transporter permease [Halobellus sp.]